MPAEDPCAAGESVAMAIAARACIRGNRLQPRRSRDELEVGLGDRGALAPLLDCGSGAAALQLW